MHYTCIRITINSILKKFTLKQVWKINIFFHLMMNNNDNKKIKKKHISYKPILLFGVLVGVRQFPCQPRTNEASISGFSVYNMVPILGCTMYSIVTEVPANYNGGCF